MFNAATGNFDTLEDTGYSRDQLESWVRSTSSSYGLSLPASEVSSDADNLARKLMGGSGYIARLGGDPRKAFGEFEEQYKRRGGADLTPGVEGTGYASSETLSIGTTAKALAGIQPSGPAPVQVSRAVTYAPSPPLVSTILSQGSVAAPSEVPTVGPTGLAYTGDPVNYATGQQGPQYGYNGDQSGTYQASGGGLGGPPAPALALVPNTGGALGGESPWFTWALLAGMAAGAYFLFVKK